MLKLDSPGQTVRVVIENNIRKLVQDPHGNTKYANDTEKRIRIIEIEMRALFFHSACEDRHIRAYLHLEWEWKRLTQYK